MTSRPKKSPSSKRENNREATKARKRPPGGRNPARLSFASSRLRGARKAADFPWWDPESQVERATEIVPLWVAEGILGEAGAWLRTTLPAEWPAALAAKAERCFAGHRQFHRLISARGNWGNAGIDNLRQFMRHWLASRLARERRSLYRQLPESYALGMPLPVRQRLRA